MGLIDAAETYLDEFAEVKKERDYWHSLAKSYEHTILKFMEAAKENADAIEPEWIPMTERKPEVGQDVLITSDNGHVLAVTYAHDVWSGENYFDWIPRFMGMGYLPEKEVVAWMPLPKPYQEGEE